MIFKIPWSWCLLIWCTHVYIVLVPLLGLRSFPQHGNSFLFSNLSESNPISSARAFEKLRNQAPFPVQSSPFLPFSNLSSKCKRLSQWFCWNPPNIESCWSFLVTLHDDALLQLTFKNEIWNGKKSADLLTKIFNAPASFSCTDHELSMLCQRKISFSVMHFWLSLRKWLIDCARRYCLLLLIYQTNHQQWWSFFAL